MRKKITSELQILYLCTHCLYMMYTSKADRQELVVAAGAQLERLLKRFLLIMDDDLVYGFGSFPHVWTVLAKHICGLWQGFWVLIGCQRSLRFTKFFIFVEKSISLSTFSSSINHSILTRHYSMVIWCCSSDMIGVRHPSYVVNCLVSLAVGSCPDRFEVLAANAHRLLVVSCVK